MGVRGTDPPGGGKSTYNSTKPYEYAVPMSVVPPSMVLLKDLTILASRSTVVFTIEKSLYVCGPAQFKGVLFKGHLYNVSDYFIFLL